MVCTRGNLHNVSAGVPHETFVPSPKFGPANKVVHKSSFREEMGQEKRVRAFFKKSLDGGTGGLIEVRLPDVIVDRKLRETA